VETVSLSASFVLLMVFTTTEPLTRLPAGHRFASNAESPERLPRSPVVQSLPFWK